MFNPAIAGVVERSANKSQVSWPRYRDLIIVTAVRSLKVRYRGSILGVYWSLSNPLLMTGIYTAIFGTAFSKYYGGSIFNYVLAVFTGLAVLNFFSQSTSMALTSIVSNGGLLNKIAIPPSIFPLAQITAASFQLCAGVLPLLLVVTFVISHSLINVVALLVPMLGLVLLSTGFAMAAAGTYVYFRDLSYIYELVIFIIWFTSPIFYPAAIVPPSVRRLLNYNPLAAIIESVRQIALSASHPSLHMMAGALIAGMLSIVVGVSIYWAIRRGFMDLV